MLDDYIKEWSNIAVPEDPSPLERSDEENKNAKTEAWAAEAAAIRRRWITLGEILGVLALIISGLTLWNSWTERSEGEATKSAEARRVSARATTLTLTAVAESRHMLLLKPASLDQLVQSQTISFPSALDADAVETTGEPRIEAAWFESALKKARSAARQPDDSRGDERLPVVITTRFLVGGNRYEDVAIYDIGYTISGRWFAGHTVNLRGLSLVSRLKAGTSQQKLDTRWKQILPKK